MITHTQGLGRCRCRCLPLSVEQLLTSHASLPTLTVCMKSHRNYLCRRDSLLYFMLNKIKTYDRRIFVM